MIHPLEQLPFVQLAEYLQPVILAVRLQQMIQYTVRCGDIIQSLQLWKRIASALLQTVHVKLQLVHLRAVMQIAFGQFVEVEVLCVRLF